MMKTVSFRILAALTLFFAVTALPCAARTVKVAFGDALPPWVIPGTDSGILIEIVKQSLEPAGYQVQNVYVPYARRLITYKNGNVDGVCDINPNIVTSLGLDGYLSDIAYSYENIGVALSKKNYRFSSIGELRSVSLASWQGARAAIGGDYADMASQNPQYREMANQKLQVYLLYSERIDVIQLDRHIFQYFCKKVAEEGRVDTTQPIDTFPLFGKNDCGFLFRDREVQAAFNEHFNRLKQTGGYDGIFRKYLP